LAGCTYAKISYNIEGLFFENRDTLEAYSRELKNTAMKTLVYIAKALKMETDEMTVLFEEGMQAMRMNYYPACPEPEKAIGLTPHSDAVGITFLLQLNEVQGLQIRKDDIWISIIPLPNAFIVNIGEILEVIYIYNSCVLYIYICHMHNLD